MEVSTLTSALRETIGTPFHHGGRVNKVGLDCGGMMIVALRSLGYEVYDKPFYNKGDYLNEMVEVLRKNNFQRMEAGEPNEVSIEPGDFVLLRQGSLYHHLVYFTEDETIIHAWVTSGVNKVVESTMVAEWYSQVHSVWRFKDLD